MQIMRKILLSKNKVAIINNEDFEKVNKFKWHFSSGYAHYSYWKKGKYYKLLMHRLINNTPKGMNTDHINGDKLDNRKENLRTVTTSQNANNRHAPNSNNTSGFLGVTIHNIKYGLWRARISIEGKRITLGLFKNAKDANEACIEARRKYHVF